MFYRLLRVHLFSCGALRPGIQLSRADAISIVPDSYRVSYVWKHIDGWRIELQTEVCEDFTITEKASILGPSPG